MMDKEQKMCKTYKTLLYVSKAETIPINVHQLVDMYYIISIKQNTTQQ